MNHTLSMFKQLLEQPAPNRRRPNDVQIYNNITAGLRALDAGNGLRALNAIAQARKDYKGNLHVQPRVWEQHVIQLIFDGEMGPILACAPAKHVAFMEAATLLVAIMKKNGFISDFDLPGQLVTDRQAKQSGPVSERQAAETNISKNKEVEVKTTAAKKRKASETAEDAVEVPT